MSEDLDNISDYLVHSYDFISDILASNMNLLIHSQDGLSRAPAIVIGYLIKKYRLGFE